MSSVHDGSDGAREALPTPAQERVAKATADVVEALRGEILDGTFPPGTRLGQELLAERFGASRMPVRQALRELEAQGLVTIVRNSGAWVAQLDADDFDQTYRLRLVVEPFALQESLPRLTDADLQELGELCRALGEAAEPPLDVDAFLDLDRQFHLATYRGVQHRQLREIVERLWNTTQHYRRVLLGRLDEDAVCATQQDHELILDAIRRGDAESAAKLVWIHVRRTQHALEEMEDIFT